MNSNTTKSLLADLVFNSYFLFHDDNTPSDTRESIGGVNDLRLRPPLFPFFLAETPLMVFLFTVGFFF